MEELFEYYFTVLFVLSLTKSEENDDKFKAGNPRNKPDAFQTNV